jgi:hypothetical protein
MPTLSTRDFFWRIIGGFVIGVAGFAAFVPASTAAIVEAVTRL